MDFKSTIIRQIAVTGWAERDVNGVRLTVVPLTFGRGRVTRGDGLSIDDNW